MAKSLFKTIATLLGLMTAGGCSTQLPSAAVSQIEQANQQYQRGRSREARALLDPVISKHGQAPGIEEALYVRGLCLAKLGERSAAKRDFESALPKSTRPDLTGRLHASLGQLEFDDGRFPAAAGHFAQCADHLTDQRAADQILYRYGMSLLRMGRWNEARSQFSRLVSRFPQSPYVEDAARKLAWQHDYFAIQCGSYNDRPSAEAAKSRFAGRGLAVDYSQLPYGKVTRHILTTGSYRAYEQAAAALSGVRRVQADAFVVP